MHSSMARLCSIVTVLLGVSMAGCAAPVDAPEAGTTPVADDSAAAPGEAADDEKQPEEGDDVPPPATVAAGDVRPQSMSGCTVCHMW